MTDSDQILRAIEQRIAEAGNEIDALTAARGALLADGAVATRLRASGEEASAPRPARATRRRRRPARRSSAVVVPAGKLETLLEGTDGLSTTQLAELSGGERTQLLSLLRELTDNGTIRRSGAKRGTRWHLITDEDRLRERTAELEAIAARAPRKAA